MKKEQQKIGAKSIFIGAIVGVILYKIVFDLILPLISS